MTALVRRAAAVYKILNDRFCDFMILIWLNRVTKPEIKMFGFFKCIHEIKRIHVIINVAYIGGVKVENLKNGRNQGC